MITLRSGRTRVLILGPLLSMCVFLLLSGCARSSDNRLVVAAGTTIVDSGLVDVLAARYASDFGVDVVVVGGSSAEVLTLLDAGEADVAITHHPELESVYREAHTGVTSAEVFTSQFVLVGPPQQVDAVANLTVEDAMALIAERRWTFVSRADGSGTAAKEDELWLASGVEPDQAEWRIETGQGMGATLQIADQRNAFVLAELGAFLGASGLDLAPADTVGGGVDLTNPYTAWFIAGDDVAAGFVAWLVDSGGGLAAEYAREEFGVDVYRSAG